MAYDLKELLRNPVTASERRARAVLDQERIDAGWADYGRIVHHNATIETGIETVINRMGLREGVTVRRIADAVRAFIVSGALP